MTVTEAIKRSMDSLTL